MVGIGFGFRFCLVGVFWGGGLKEVWFELFGFFLEKMVLPFCSFLKIVTGN